MPKYLNLNQMEFKEKIESAWSRLEKCNLCPRQCSVQRIKGESGFCQTKDKARVASYNLHFGEEAPLVGQRGSGTIFFAGCNLGCLFCQNYDISHDIKGSAEVTDEQLAAIMLDLQNKGALNINLVSPTHVLPQILSALGKAVQKGLRIPIVYNSGGYDLLETLKLLDGVVDIYMPDAKFFDPKYSKKYCQAEDYPATARKAIKEMHKQCKDLVLDEKGIAQQGLLVRHLLMPEGLAGTRQWLEFIAREISPKTYLNIMNQYRPCGRANEFPELMGTVSPKEQEQACQLAREMGLTRLDQRSEHLLKNIFRLFDS